MSQEIFNQSQEKLKVILLFGHDTHIVNSLKDRFDAKIANVNPGDFKEILLLKHTNRYGQTTTELALKLLLFDRIAYVPVNILKNDKNWGFLYDHLEDLSPDIILRATTVLDSKNFVGKKGSDIARRIESSSSHKWKIKLVNDLPFEIQNELNSKNFGLTHEKQIRKKFGI